MTEPQPPPYAAPQAIPQATPPPPEYSIHVPSPEDDLHVPQAAPPEYPTHVPSPANDDLQPAPEPMSASKRFALALLLRLWQFLVGLFELFTYVVLILGAYAAYGDQDFTTSFPGLFKARCSQVFTAAQDVSQDSMYLYSFHRDKTVLRVCTEFTPEEWRVKARLDYKDYDCLGDPLDCATHCSSIQDRDAIISQVTVRGSSLTTAQVLDLPPNMNGTGWAWSFDVDSNSNAKFPNTDTCVLDGTGTYFREISGSVKDWTSCPYPNVFEASSTRKTVLGLLAATLSEAITSAILIAAALCPCFMNWAMKFDPQFRANRTAHRRALLCETPFALLYALVPTTQNAALTGPFVVVSVLNDFLVFICVLAVCRGCHLMTLPLLAIIMIFKIVKILVAVLRFFRYCDLQGVDGEAAGNAGGCCFVMIAACVP